MNMRRAAAGLAVAWAVAFPIRPAHALDLAQVLEQVSLQSPNLAMRAAMVDAAGRRVQTASVWTGPELMFGVENVPTNPLAFNRDPMTMQTIELRQRIPISPTRGLRKGAASEGVAAAQAELTLARYQQWGEAWEAYANAYFADLLAAEAEQHRSVMNRIVAAARTQYESGRGRLDAV